MSKFIKLSVIIMALCLAAACCGCGPPLYQIYFDEFFYDDQDAITISYKANQDNPENVKKFAKLNTDTYKWETSTVTGKILTDEQITTFGKTIIKNSDNAVIFEQSIPSISEIAIQADISLPDAEAYYNYFRTGNDYRWDRKTIIINVGISKKTEDRGDNSFAGIHSFLAEYDKINSLWNIQHSGEILGDRFYSDNLKINHASSFYSFSSSNSWENRFFVDSNISLCQSWLKDGTASLIYDKSIKCLVKYENGEVSLQKLYGEILPVQYSDVLQGLYEKSEFSSPADSRVFFDENQNMYVLHNNTEEAKGEYFYFEMYKPDNPTVAQHKQKIYWD